MALQATFQASKESSLHSESNPRTWKRISFYSIPDKGKTLRNVHDVKAIRKTNKNLVSKSTNEMEERQQTSYPNK